MLTRRFSQPLRKWIFRIVSCAIAIGAVSAFAGTLVLQPGSEGKDTYVCDCLPNVNNPNGPITVLYQGRYGSCYDRILLQWDISALPQNISITGAVMELKCIGIYGSVKNGQMVYYRITGGWEETKVTTSTLPVYTNEDSVVTEWPASGKWHAVDVTKFVQKWHEDSTSNRGIYGHTVNATAQWDMEFNSSDVSVAANRPKLTITYTELSQVDQPVSRTISHFQLDQNYPNPFNPTTTIHYAIPKDGMVSLKIYNLMGEAVATLINQTQNAGEYEAEFNGSGLGDGVYFYKLQAGDFYDVKKLILIK
jgi:hypothetical protein